MFGNSPAETRMGGANVTWDYARAREAVLKRGGQVIITDPRMNETATGHHHVAHPFGKIGLPGTNTGQREAEPAVSLVGSFSATVPNPVTAIIPVYQWLNAVDHGHEMTTTNSGIWGTDKLSSDIKFVWDFAGNCLTNQHGDINYTHDICFFRNSCLRGQSIF